YSMYRQSPVLNLIRFYSTKLKQARDGATHPAAADPFSLCETPVELCAEGEIRGRAQPPKTSTFAYPQPLQQRIKYGATPTSVLSPSVKPDLENAQTMHHEIQECAATQDPDSQVPTTHTTTKRVRRHTPTKAGFLTPRNPHPKNPWTRPGRNTGMRTATQDPNPCISPTPTTTNQVWHHTPTSVLSPSAKPDPENAQTMHHEIQECAATQDPDSRVPTTHMMTKRVRRHTPTKVDFLTPQNPPSKESTGKAWAKYGHAHSHPRP
ncbi:hypothetical protein BS47DRAFT_1369955, partial [Hydnum rufescens UP504]